MGYTMKKKSDEEIATDDELKIIREKLETETDVFEKLKLKRKLSVLEKNKNNFLEARRTW